MKPQLAEYLMRHGVLKNADAQTMAGEIADMLGVEKLANHSQVPTIVCLCGSTRFWREFQRASLRETLAGKIVLSIGAASGTDDEHFGNLSAVEYQRLKASLDELHKRKIDLADEVLVLNVGGYIGESTRSEIEHAKKRGKTIRFLEPTHVHAIGQMPIKQAADGKVVPVTDTDIVVSSRENYERVMDENLKLIERNHELEQKELMRSASRPAEAAAMRNVLEESKRLKEQLDSVQTANAELREFALARFSREQVKPLVEALEALKHADGCYCEASFSGPGCHPRHSPECVAACNALTHARAVGMEDKP